MSIPIIVAIATVAIALGLMGVTMAWTFTRFALVDEVPQNFAAKAKKNPKQIRAWGSTVLPQRPDGRHRGVGGWEDAARPTLWRMDRGAAALTP